MGCAWTAPSARDALYPACRGPRREFAPNLLGDRPAGEEKTMLQSSSRQAAPPTDAQRAAGRSITIAITLSHTAAACWPRTSSIDRKAAIEQRRECRGPARAALRSRFPPCSCWQRPWRRRRGRSGTASRSSVRAGDRAPRPLPPPLPRTHTQAAEARAAPCSGARGGGLPAAAARLGGIGAGILGPGVQAGEAAGGVGAAPAAAAAASGGARAAGRSALVPRRRRGFHRSMVYNLTSLQPQDAAGCEVRPPPPAAATPRRRPSPGPLPPPDPRQQDPAPPSTTTTTTTQVALLQHLPPDLFADPYQLEDVTRFRGGQLAGAASSCPLATSCLPAPGCRRAARPRGQPASRPAPATPPRRPRRPRQPHAHRDGAAARRPQAASPSSCSARWTWSCERGSPAPLPPSRLEPRLLDLLPPAARAARCRRGAGEPWSSPRRR
jgi:hypothetical protein